jgi:hypothetical protein
MALQAIIKANHTSKKATLSIVDDKTDFSPLDAKGKELRGMKFPYFHLIAHEYLFEKLGSRDDGFEYYVLNMLYFGK